MITDMIISAFAQQSHITVTGRGRAGSESEIKIMKKMEKSKVYVLVFKDMSSRAIWNNLRHIAEAFWGFTS